MFQSIWKCQGSGSKERSHRQRKPSIERERGERLNTKPGPLENFMWDWPC